jgi:hypothetical protein
MSFFSIGRSCFTISPIRFAAARMWAELCRRISIGESAGFVPPEGPVLSDGSTGRDNIQK